MGKSIALAALIVFLLLAIGFQYYITSLPDLEEPVTIGEAWLVSDGGSISVSFVDGDGDAFQIGVRGDLTTNPEAFSFFYIRNPEWVPYVRWPAIGGRDEKAFLRFLDQWLQENVKPALREKLKSGGVQGLDQSEMEVAAVNRIYELLRGRNQP